VFSFRNWGRKRWGRELGKFRERKKHDPFITGGVSGLFETLLCTWKLNRYGDTQGWNPALLRLKKVCVVCIVEVHLLYV